MSENIPRNNLGDKNLNKKIVSLDELMAKNLPPIQWLIDGLVPEAAITIMPGASGSFKTWLAMSMALSIANGEDFLDVFTTRQANVLIIDEEGGERLYSERFKLLDAPDDSPVYLMSMSNFVANDRSVNDIIKECKEKGIELVVIDSLVRINSGDENSSKDIAKLFSSLRAFNNESIAVLIIHHNRKPGRDGYNPSFDMRGSSDIKAAVDVQLAIRRIGKTSSIQLERAKCRYEMEGMPFKLDFIKNEDTGKLRFVYAGTVKSKATEDDKEKETENLKDTIISVVREFPNTNKGAIVAVIVNRTKIGKTRINTEILNLVKLGILTTENGPHNSTVLSVSEAFEDSEGVSQL